MKFQEDNFWNKEFHEYLSGEQEKDDYSYENYSPAKFYSLEAMIERQILPLINSNFSCLELGSGSGIILSMLSKLGVCCVGIDRSKKAIEFSRYICKKRKTKVKFYKKDIFEFECDSKFDIVINGGVIEHFNIERQSELVKKMRDLSKRFVLISIPNNDSPIYTDFINYVTREGNLYYVEEFDVNIPELFIKNNIKILKKDGFHLFNSKEKFLNHEREDITNLYLKLLKRSKIKYFDKTNFPRIDFRKQDIPTLKILENLATPEERYTFGFMRSYLGEING